MISIHLPCLQRLTVRFVVAAEIYVPVRIAVFRLTIWYRQIAAAFVFSWGFTHAMFCVELVQTTRIGLDRDFALHFA